MDISDESIKDIITSKLRMVEDLRAKLVHVQWSQDSFILLTRIIRDTLEDIDHRGSYRELLTLLRQVEHVLERCRQEARLPQGDERAVLLQLLESVQQRWLQIEPVDPIATVSHLPDELLLVGSELALRSLIVKLSNAGFRVIRIDNLDRPPRNLLGGSVGGIIVDLDSAGDDSQHCLHQIRDLRQRLGLLPPLFILAERGDLAARLDATRTGSSAYFTKPWNTNLLLERLFERINQAASQRYRVLILDAVPAEAGTMARTLESKGILTQVITQPRRVIQAIHRFQPHLLIVDLAIEEPSGPDLAQVIRQHEACDDLPVILLSTPQHLSHHLNALGPDSGDLLLKPLARDYLLAAVSYRLRRVHRLHDKLKSLGQQDTASGLYNRRFFLDQFELRLNRIASRVALLLVSLDNLRAMESIDVVTVDEMVEWAARRLMRVLGPGQRAARFGDTVFAVLVDNDDPTRLRDLALRVRTALEGDTYQTGDTTVQIYVSIGISVAHDNTRDMLTLIQQADLACSLARKGDEPVHIYHPTQDRKVAESHEKRLLDEVREAVKAQRMGLAFQAIVNLRGDHNERYEVLLRMRNQEGRELLPESVFGVAQRYRLGVMLDRWVIAHSIALLRQRQKRGQIPTLFINLSEAILQDASFHDWLSEGIRKTGTQGNYLVFEIPETSAEKHVEKVRHFIDHIQPLGCSFSLDHFGCRAQSLDLLSELSVGYVKLDPYFAYNLVGNADKQEQLRTLANALHKLHITPVMGSIEDLPTLYALWSCGINYVQGFFLQRPTEEMSYNFEESFH